MRLASFPTENIQFVNRISFKTKLFYIFLLLSQRIVTFFQNSSKKNFLEESRNFLEIQKSKFRNIPKLSSFKSSKIENPDVFQFF